MLKWEIPKEALRPDFDRSILVDFRGAKIISVHPGPSFQESIKDVGVSESSAKRWQ